MIILQMDSCDHYENIYNLFSNYLQDPKASYDFNDSDDDPQPRYDFTDFNRSMF